MHGQMASMASPRTSISILDARLKLLSIPRADLRAQSYAITRSLAFRRDLSARGLVSPGGSAECDGARRPTLIHPSIRTHTQL